MATEVKKWQSDDGRLFDTKIEAIDCDTAMSARSRLAEEMCDLVTDLASHGCVSVNVPALTKGMMFDFIDENVCELYEYIVDLYENRKYLNKQK